MKQYMLSVHNDPTVEMSDYTPEDMQRMYAQVGALNEELQSSGAWVFAGGLTEPDTATTVSHTNGEIVMTDGPYAETKEYLGGFWVIQAEDLDAALEWAKRATVACEGPVEVRPFQDEPPA